MIDLFAMIAALAVTLALTIGPVPRSENWRATVTPLASIIGSGFLICGPLLAREFGTGALGAMAALLVVAYAAGTVLRFNIRHLEPLAENLTKREALFWSMRAAQGLLGLAYAVSVAYYLKLLAEFALKRVPIAPPLHTLVANAAVSAIILGLVALTFSGSIRRIEHAAHATVSLKIGLIAGMLAGLAVWWWLHLGHTQPLPPLRLGWHSVSMLLGLIVTVQGFETSRYLGDSYDREVRIRAMRLAQLVSSAIYLLFVGLLTPFLAQAQSSEGVAAILDVMGSVSALLGIFVLIGAAASQLSAAIADSIGAGGLVVEVSGRRLGTRGAFIVTSTLSLGVVWLTDPFQVVALASRAFALYYAAQATLAVWTMQRTGAGGIGAMSGAVMIGFVCLLAAAVGAPAEG